MQAEQPPQPGQLIGGKYRIVRTLGSGAMGVVYEAQHIATGKRVAVKWLHADVMQSRSAVERLVREAQASARVRHSNVVDVYDVEREGDTLFLVMEYLEGEPLSSLLERGGVPVHELLAIIVQAMRGVAEAHRRGVIHRDIKPENIFLAEEPDQPTAIVKVLDFGVSKMDNPGGVSLTQTGSALGTPLYMSYEQLSGVRDVDARSDVYGFGVILYEALTGTLPFTADSFAELAAKVITSEPIPPRQIRPDIPERLEEVVLWAMKKRREERAPNLGVLIDALLPFTRAREGRVSLSSPRLPALGALAASPVLPPAPPPSTPGLKLDEHVDWNAVLDRSQRERRAMEESVTALIAGTMYEERKKRKEGRGAWLGLAAVGALALGITLATLMRDGGERSAQSAPEEPSALASPAPAPEQAEPLASAKRSAGAAGEQAKPAPAPAPELLQAASPTQVEPMHMPKADALADAGVDDPSGLGPLARPPATPGELPAKGELPANAQPAAGQPGAGVNRPLPQRAAPNAPTRPKFEGPSGEWVAPPPPPVVEPPAPLEPPAAAEPAAAPEDPLPSEERPVEPPAPSDPVDVNPFEDDEPDAYRAGRPREDEF